MIIETSRFGPTEVDENRFIRFQLGVLGFPKEKEYALIQTAEGSGFYWLQAVTRADLAFVVCDPPALPTRMSLSGTEAWGDR